MRVNRRPVCCAMLVVVGLLVAAPGVPCLLEAATTRQGINFHVSTKPIPLHVKALDFLHRHYQYQLLAQEITKESRSDEDRVMAIFKWTREQIRPTPPDWPVVDDHILHIIIRGHGLPDQMADVFTTLCTYAGVPAFWRILTPPDSGVRLIISMVKIENRWVLFDVANDLVFRNAGGEPASIEDISADPGLVTKAANGLRPGNVPYEIYFTNSQPWKIPHMLRARLQMPGPRLWYEARRRLVGLSGQDDK